MVEFERLCVDVDADVVQKIRIKSAVEKVSMKSIVNRYLDDGLKRDENQQTLNVE